MRFTAWISRIALCACAVALVAGCAPKAEEVLVPKKETAREQYAVARGEFERRKQVPVKKESRGSHYHPVIVSYEKVRELFPDDKRYTPLAMLDIAGIYHKELEDPRLALKYYEWVRDNCDYDDFLQAQSLVMMGICLESLGKPEKANELYIECIEVYDNHPTKMVIPWVERAKKLYNKVKTK